MVFKRREKKAQDVGADCHGAERLAMTRDSGVSAPRDDECDVSTAGRCGHRPLRDGAKTDGRSVLSDGLIVGGAGLLVLGAFLIWLPAGFFLAGAVLMLLGWLIGAEGGDAD